MEVTDKIAFAALIIASLSFVVSVIGIIISYKSHKINKTQNEERYKPIVSYLNDAFRIIIDKQEYIFFALTYTNTSTLGITIQNHILEIEYFDKERTSHKVKLESNNDVNIDNIIKDQKELDELQEIPSLGSVAGWIKFKLPKTILMKDKRIEGYKIIATTSLGEKIENEIYIVKRKDIDE